jgi:hypothetical protein
MELEDAPTFENIRRKRHSRLFKEIKKRPRCGIKAKFGYSKTGVITAISQQKKLYGVKYLRGYRCTRCPYWHLTSQPLSTVKAFGDKRTRNP